MSYLRLSNEQRREAIFSLAAEKTGLSLQSSVGVMRSLAELVDSLMQNAYKDLHFVEAQLNIDTAEGFYLDNFGRMLNLPRQDDTPTRIILPVTLNTSSVQSLTIPKGSRVYRLEEEGGRTGIEFNAAEELVLTAENISGDLLLVSNIKGEHSRPSEGSTLVYARAGDELNEREIAYSNINTAITAGTDRWNDAYYRVEIQNQWHRLILGDISADYEAIAKQFVFDARIQRIISATHADFTLWVSTKNGDGIQEPEQGKIEDALNAKKLVTTRFNILDAAPHYVEKEPAEGESTEEASPEDSRNTIDIDYAQSLAVRAQEIKDIAGGYLLNLRIGETYYESELYNRFKDAGIPSDSIQINFTHSVVRPTNPYTRFRPRISFPDESVIG